MHAVTLLLALLAKKSRGTDCEEKERQQQFFLHPSLPNEPILLSHMAMDI